MMTSMDISNLIRKLKASIRFLSLDSGGLCACKAEELNWRGIFGRNMADAQIRLNPHKVLFLTKTDPEWRSLNPGKITPESKWLVHLELEPDQDPEEMISIHEVNQRVSQIPQKSKPWGEFLLKDLHILADGGRPNLCCASPGSGKIRHRTMMI